jgi:hypothetical protein
MIRRVAGALLALSFLIAGAIAAGDEFPFDQELLLDSAPMRPGKRMPILVVEANGSANIDLWCKTVSARIEISGSAIKIEPGPLPEGLPEMLSAGQCTPERIKADEKLLVDLAQVTAWQRENGGIVLVGPTPLKFRPSDH